MIIATIFFSIIYIYIYIYTQGESRNWDGLYLEFGNRHKKKLWREKLNVW